MAPRSRSWIAILGLMLGLELGCFDPTVSVRCAETRLCPETQVCNPQGFCVPVAPGARDAAVDALPPQGDADVDAVSMPACQSDPVYEAPLAGSTYRFESVMMIPWDEAREACQAAGADLVVIESAAENDHLIAQLTPTVTLWIGLGVLDDRWAWVDGTDLANYANWRNGEPPATEGDCARLRLSSGSPGQWNANSCSMNRGFVCECRAAP